jgi:hypothetical protein
MIVAVEPNTIKAFEHSKRSTNQPSKGALTVVNDFLLIQVN